MIERGPSYGLGFKHRDDELLSRVEIVVVIVLEHGFVLILGECLGLLLSLLLDELDDLVLSLFTDGLEGIEALDHGVFGFGVLAHEGACLDVEHHVVVLLGDLVDDLQLDDQGLAE